MKKRRHKPAHPKNFGEPLWWLPVDSRLLPPIFSFSHVRGLPRIFLQVEMLLASLIVVGTLCIVILKILVTVL